MPLETTILPRDETSRTVDVRFVDGAIMHERQVNACFDSDGRYDVAATAARVADVGRGVAIKIALGVIVNPPPAPEAASTAA